MLPRPRPPRERAFTLIELLVVISIIALLIGILLPALGAARRSAQTTFCATNTRTIAQAVTIFEQVNKKLPLSYHYPDSPKGSNWRVQDQRGVNPNPQNGYLHWSYFMFDDGAAPQDAFECPTVTNRGAPRTNPGRNRDDWEDGQVNGGGQAFNGQELPEDRQAKRNAFTANAALLPRPVLVNENSSERRTQQVKFVDLSNPSRIILATEYADSPGWRTLYRGTGGNTDGGEILSHRPVMPFYGGSSGYDVLREPEGRSGRPRFFYAPESTILAENEEIPTGVIDSPERQLNAVGRHHPGKTANFVFADGHVETLKLIETVRKKLWGDRVYGISGNNAVDLDRTLP